MKVNVCKECGTHLPDEDQLKMVGEMVARGVNDLRKENETLKARIKELKKKPLFNSATEYLESDMAKARKTNQSLRTRLRNSRPASTPTKAMAGDSRPPLPPAAARSLLPVVEANGLGRIALVLSKQRGDVGRVLDCYIRDEEPAFRAQAFAYVRQQVEDEFHREHRRQTSTIDRQLGRRLPRTSSRDALRRRLLPLRLPQLLQRLLQRPLLLPMLRLLLRWLPPGSPSLEPQATPHMQSTARSARRTRCRTASQCTARMVMQICGATVPQMGVGMWHPQETRMSTRTQDMRARPS